MEETCNVGKLWELNGYQGGSQPLLHNTKIAHNGNHRYPSTDLSDSYYWLRIYTSYSDHGRVDRQTTIPLN